MYHNTAAGLVLAQIISMQLGSAAAKDLFGRAGPAGMAGLRIAGTALVLIVLVRPRLRGLNIRQLTAAVGLGLVVAAMNLAYFHAIATIPIGVASSLELLGPLGLSMVMSRRAIDLLGSGLSATGLSLLAIPHSELDVAGLAFGAIAGLLRTGYVLLNSATPAIAAMIGYAVLDEYLTTRQFVAIGLISAASMAAVRANRRANAGSDDH